MSHRFRAMPALIPVEQVDEVALEELETAEAIGAVAALEAVAAATAAEDRERRMADVTKTRTTAWARTFLGLDTTSPDESGSDVAPRDSRVESSTTF